ncbi:MAG: hypothetical protein BHV87_11290 [Clostridiales bacterium 36_14]|nr:MAG: hypothetical protein BHV87_11290 [Clostridiales bacterium 36_14]
MFKKWCIHSIIISIYCSFFYYIAYNYLPLSAIWQASLTSFLPYYEYYNLDGTQEVPNDYNELSFVCLRPDGCLELPSTLGTVCRTVAKRLDEFEGFHFHQLRHTYTSNLLANGAAPKDVQELLGHSDVSTTMNVYAHSTRKAKRESARLLDKVAGND